MSLPSSPSRAWSGVRKPRHFRGVRLCVSTISCSSASPSASRSRSRGRSRRRRPFAFSTAPQQPPELLGFLPGPVTEGVDGLAGHGAQPALLAPLEPAGDLLRRPAFQQALADEAAEALVALEDGL